MKHIVLAAAALIIPGVAVAQQAALISGTVQKVDASAEKITLKHGPIPNLDMGEMTMVFKAGDKSMLDQVKAGDKVQFTADRVNGQITVTSLQKMAAPAKGQPAAKKK